MIHPLFAFNLPSGQDLFFILALAFLLFGAKKLPELARGLGQSLGEFKKARDEFEREIHKSTTDVQIKDAPGKEPYVPSTGGAEVRATTDKEPPKSA